MQTAERFAQWIEQSSLPRCQVADRLKVSKSVVTRWCGGSRVPLRKSARDIEFLTKGAIKASDWGYLEKGSVGVNKVRRFMVREGLSLAGLSARLGVGKTTVQRWLCGDTVPSEESLKRLSECMKVKFKPNDF